MSLFTNLTVEKLLIDATCCPLLARTACRVYTKNNSENAGNLKSASQAKLPYFQVIFKL